MWILTAKMRLPVASRYSLGSLEVNNQPVWNTCRIKELEGYEKSSGQFALFLNIKKCKAMCSGHKSLQE